MTDCRRCTADRPRCMSPTLAQVLSEQRFATDEPPGLRYCICCNRCVKTPADPKTAAMSDLSAQASNLLVAQRLSVTIGHD
jgi:hypothetical protein